MRSRFLMTPVLLLALAGPAAAKAPDTLRSIAQVAVSVSEHGRVSSLELTTAGLPEAISTPLLREMETWEFEPAVANGQSVPSLTHVHVTLLAEPVTDSGDAYAVRIVDVMNGPAKVHAAPPRYPLAAIQGRLEALVVVEVDIASDGSVRDVRVDSVETEARANRVQLLVQATLSAVQKWRFAPEQVNGKPIAATVKVPLAFCINRASCFEAPKGSPAKRSGELIADAPATRLKSDVVGRTL